ncbi:LANO_0G05864g1_1 [Lachancea nothofagi CBS 11611]|uniref:LANO_0G05864g1_1 n=1 Tax=Lachancea nothofagi CBS 11611 TaxID=1266666 RepID=A0A1G4KGT1_9SACH|nr:LANO_0G05864g1_1 [Lachancea nothofagi CBS 11611]
MYSYPVKSTSFPNSSSKRGTTFLSRKTGISGGSKDDSDDDNMIGPPKLSNFGSALLSDKENVEPDTYALNNKPFAVKRFGSFQDAPQAASRRDLVEFQRTRTLSNGNGGSGGPYATFQSEDHSDSTMFANSKDHQQSMTTFNPELQPEFDKAYTSTADGSHSKLKNLQQTLKDELLTRSSRRKNRRFISSRLSLLGPAKRAGSATATPNKSELADDSNASQLEINFSNSSSAGGTINNKANNGYNVFYEPHNGSPPSLEKSTGLTSSSVSYENIEFGELNPYQYLKKHNLPTTELPNISRVYFERQKGENRRTALRKNTATKDAIQNRLATASLSSSPLLKHIEPIKREPSATKREPRRKASDSATNNASKVWSSPLSGPANTTTASAKSAKTHDEEDKYEIAELNDRNTLNYIRRREALSNIDINSSRTYQHPHKKTKYAFEGTEDGNNDYKSEIYRGNQPSNSEQSKFVHRDPPAAPTGKHVEILEPVKSIERVPLKPPASGIEQTYKKRPIVTVNGTEYEKLELLGRGGSSKVYKVKNATNNKVYALKRVSFDEFDDSSVDGFKGEIELLKKLESKPRVVRLIDHEMEHGVLYVVMECGDHDLSHTLAQRSGMALDVEFVRYHAQEMLKCVKVVHDAGIVHSDLKPANFVFVKGILKIIDFGIANAVPEHTVNIYRETQIGTPNYMAPEALVAMNFTHDQPAEQSRWKVGKPSDIWSCGCIIYQMIYGRPPYGGFQGQNRLLAIMNPEVKIVYPEKTPSGEIVPKTAIDTMKACLERNPDKRWTVEEALMGSFVKPIAVTHFFVRDLIKNSVKYGFNQRELSNEKIEELADDVWHRLAEFRL